MSEHLFAERAAEWLREERDAVGPRPSTAPEPIVAAIADAIRAQARRRRARTAFKAVAIALAAGGAGIWLVHARAPGVPVAERAPAPGVPVAGHAPAPGQRTPQPTAATLEPNPTAEQPGSASADDEPSVFTVARAGAAKLDGGAGARAATVGTAFTAGHTLASGAEPAMLTGADGTEVHLGPRSEVALVRADAIRWLQLEGGTIEAHVAKLAAGHRFVIATPDRQVEVRGTRFRVSLAPSDPACGDGSVTRVTVDEGVVTVRAPGGAEDRVTAGQRWPADCSPARQAATDHPRKPRASTETAPALPAPTAAAAPVAPSTLAAENDLFGQAARAARAGDTAAALRRLDELLARYPESPLRSAAETERARLLERSN